MSGEILPVFKNTWQYGIHTVWDTLSAYNGFNVGASSATKAGMNLASGNFGLKLVPEAGDFEHYNGKLYFTDMTGIREELIPTINTAKFIWTDTANLADFLNQWLFINSIPSPSIGFHRVTAKVKFRASGSVNVKLRIANNNTALTYKRDFDTLSTDITVALNSGYTTYTLLDNDIIELGSNGNYLELQVDNGNLIDPLEVMVTAQKINYSHSLQNTFFPAGV